jgi:hypothetical protein
MPVAPFTTHTDPFLITRRRWASLQQAGMVPRPDHPCDIPVHTCAEGMEGSMGGEGTLPYCIRVLKMGRCNPARKHEERGMSQGWGCRPSTTIGDRAVTFQAKPGWTAMACSLQIRTSAIPLPARLHGERPDSWTTFFSKMRSHVILWRRCCAVPPQMKVPLRHSSFLLPFPRSHQHAPLCCFGSRSWSLAEVKPVVPA